MSVEPRQAAAVMPLQVVRLIDDLCDQFEQLFKQSGQLSFEPFIQQVEPDWRDALIEELVQVALERLRDQGVAEPERNLAAANPTVAALLEAMATTVDGSRTTALSTVGNSDRGVGLVVRCPLCRNPMELVVDAPLADIVCRSCGGQFSLVDDGQQTREATTLATISHFELIERVGMGEFGAVWKARDTVLDRTVAIKIPRREQLDAADVEKLLREARAAAQLRHPNIVSTHEIGRYGDTFYIVCDYVRGVPLTDALAVRSRGVREAVEIFAKIAAAVDYAHRQGIIHRDLKPSNILVDDAGEPHLMDFGLAKRRETEISVTVEGAILGTPAYMSPEQARGEAWRADGRSDVYSLGVILFQLLTAELPFRGSVRMLLHKVIHEDPPGPRSLDGNVPRDLDTICLKCLEKEPSRRYATAGELAADLRRYLANEPVSARRLSPAGRAMRWARRNPAPAFSAAALLVTLVVATGVSSYYAWRAAQSALLADRRAVEVTDRYYDSLLSEIRLTRLGREQGYGDRVRSLIAQARKLDPTDVNEGDLRTELVRTMGDFVAHAPISISGFDAKIRDFCLSRDGALIAAGLDDGQVTLCKAARGATLRPLATMEGPVLAVAFSPNHETLFAVDQTGQVRSWRRGAQTWTEQPGTRLPQPTPVAVFSAGGKLVGQVGEETIDVWDVAEVRRRRSLPVKANWSIQNLAFDHEGGRLAAGFLDVAAYRVGWVLWNVATGEQIHATQIPSLGNTYLHGIAWAPDGQRMAIGFDEELLVYDMASFEPVEFTGLDSTKAVTFGQTTPYMAAVNIRGAVNVWNAANERHLGILQIAGAPMGRNCVRVSEDGRRLVASQANEIRVWDLGASDEKTVLPGHRGGIPTATFHPSGRWLATGGKDNQVRLWEASGRQIRVVDIGEAVQTLAYSPSGRILAVGSMGPAKAPHLRLLDAESLATEVVEAPAMGDVYSLAWAEYADGTYLAGCGRRGVALWKMAPDSSTQLETVFEIPRTYCLATVLLPRRRWMIWAERERFIQGWDIDAQRELSLDAPEMLQGWHGLALLADGESIAFVSNRGSGEIWNVVDNRSARSLGAPHTFAAPHLAASPRSGWLAMLTQPHEVAVWNRTAARHVFSLRPESSTVWSLAWDPTGKRLVVGQSDGGLAVWHLDRIQEELAAHGFDWQKRQP